MCLLILELVMLVGGLYTLITGKVPDSLIGKRRTEGYEVSPGMARLVGLVMALPLPCAFLTGLMLGATMDADSMPLVASLAEGAIVVGAAILSTVIYMAARKPVEAAPSSPEGGIDTPVG